MYTSKNKMIKSKFYQTNINSRFTFIKLLICTSLQCFLIIFHVLTKRVDKKIENLKYILKCCKSINNNKHYFSKVCKVVYLVIPIILKKKPKEIKD